jgi:hypothetical protein
MLAIGQPREFSIQAVQRQGGMTAQDEKQM